MRPKGHGGSSPSPSAIFYMEIQMAIVKVKPRWLIEDFDADNKFDKLAKETKNRGYDTEVVKYVPFESGDYKRFYKGHDCVIVQASINLCKQLQKEIQWVPGPWLNSKAYECSRYYSYLGRFHVNSDYVMLPRAEVLRQMDFLKKTFGREDNALFIRPSSGHKTFTGKVFHERHFQSDWDWVEEFTDPDSLIIISSPKVIKKEWRFVVSGNRVVTGSLYREKIGPIGSGKYREIDPDNYPADKEALKKAIEIADEKYNPDPMYVIDICETENGEMRLLEIGSFSCAGLYDCNIPTIVDEAEKQALKEYEDAYGSLEYEDTSGLQVRCTPPLNEEQSKAFIQSMIDNEGKKESKENIEAGRRVYEILRNNSKDAF